MKTYTQNQTTHQKCKSKGTTIYCLAYVLAKGKKILENVKIECRICLKWNGDYCYY